MKSPKFRAVISENTTIHFSLKDMIKPLFSVRELLIPWLLEGNDPDVWTGYKDIKDKDIYVGDILRIDRSWDKSWKEPKIIYVEVGYDVGGFIIKNIDGGYVFAFVEKYPLFVSYLDAWMDRRGGKGVFFDGEVIGNIHSCDVKNVMNMENFRRG